MHMQDGRMVVRIDIFKTLTDLTMYNVFKNTHQKLNSRWKEFLLNQEDLKKYTLGSCYPKKALNLLWLHV